MPLHFCVDFWGNLSRINWKFLKLKKEFDFSSDDGSFSPSRLASITWYPTRGCCETFGQFLFLACIERDADFVLLEKMILAKSKEQEELSFQLKSLGESSYVRIFLTGEPIKGRRVVVLGLSRISVPLGCAPLVSLSNWPLLDILHEITECQNGGRFIQSRRIQLVRMALTSKTFFTFL